MKTLRTILDALAAYTPLRIPAGVDIPLSSLTCDSRKALAGSVFFCIHGANADGHTYAPSAYQNGCRIFFVQRDVDVPGDATVIRVPDTRVAMAEAAAAFYGYPAREMRLIGLTGTKGKTTTALLIRSVLEAAGIPTGYIGTNGITYGDAHFPTVNSTPESLIIHHYLRQMLDVGVRTVVMEVSSQALWMERVHGLDFDTVTFTNLSPDHIGGAEHPSFEHYKESKHRLFTEHHARTVIYNADDPASADMLRGCSATPVGITVAGNTDARWAAHRIAPARSDGHMGVSFTCVRGGQVIADEAFLPLPGAFNVQNALCALAIVCDGYGVPTDVALDALSRAVVPGRFETVTSPAAPGVTFIIDYAHNGVSLASLLDALRDHEPRRLICVFGSVGDRTRGRRTDLAVAAGCRADVCILTSDNPGREDPMDVIRDIDRAFPQGSCPREWVVDREDAVARAVEIALPGDVVVLAGKGHEDHQLVGTERIPYTDSGALAKALAARAATV